MRARTCVSVGVASLVAGVLMVGAASADTAVTTCGQVVNDKGTLPADLDCTGQPTVAVTLRPDAKLDLNGFTIRGGVTDAVSCISDCQVFSSVPGGTITGAGGNGIRAGGGVDQFGNTISGDARVTNLTISENGVNGIQTAPGNAIVRSCTVTLNGDRGVIAGVGAGRRPRIERSTITLNGNTGVETSSVRGVRIVDSQINDNGGCGGNIRNARVKRTTMSGNECGISAAGNSLRVNESMITGNAHFGVALSGGGNDCRMKLSASTITGNAFSPECGGGSPCADVGSCEPPLVIRTQCDTSLLLGVPPPAPDLDVCALD